MKTQILAFLTLFLFCASCSDENSDPLEKKTASYDVYLGGTDDYKACYWKNGQQTFVPGGENLNGIQVVVDNNDIYLLATTIQPMNQIKEWYFWKNGVKHNVAEYLNVEPNTATDNDKLFLASQIKVNNGDVYFSGVIRHYNPSTGQNTYQHCYWKNGVKTILDSHANSIFSGGLEVFNNDVYVASRKNFQYNNPAMPSWDLGYYKNNTFHVVSNSLIFHDFIKNSSNSAQFYLSTRNPNPSYISQYIYTVKDIISGNDIQIPANIIQSGIIDMYAEGTDKYYIGKDFYYKNNTLVQMNNSNGFNTISHFAAKDQNIYTTRLHPTMSSVKFYINDVEAQSLPDISKGCFNSIFVVKNN